MTTTADMALSLRAALDPVIFAKERLGFVADPWQARVLRSDARQLLICCCRQSGKSTTTAVLACHTAIHHPNSLILCVSRAQRQSIELLSKVSNFLKSMDPAPRLETDTAMACKLENGSRIVSLPGDDETIRGFSAPTLIVEDEAGFVDDTTYSAIRPMLAVSGGRLVLLSTPKGRRGHFHAAWTGGGDWHREKITAHDCPRISPEFLEQERREMPDHMFRQEYLCEFVETSDQLFGDEFIEAALVDAEPLKLRVA